MKEVYKNEKKILSSLKTASSFFSRLQGLMFTKEMIDMDGLLIEDCKSIHTCFMRFPIDVFFMNKSNEIVKIIRNMKPWRMSSFYFNASQVIETMPNADEGYLQEGDKLELRCLN